MNLIEGDISSESLRKRMKKYDIPSKRQELIENKIDSTLLSNVVNSMNFLMADINKYTGQKFLQNYIYNDNKFDCELQLFMENIDDYDVGKYIEQVVRFTYRFIVIHPFRDGNGRISMAILNWLLSKKKIPPIYIDSKCKKEYLEAFSMIDLKGDFVPFIMLIEKRIIHTMIELHKYLFVDEIDEKIISDVVPVN